MKHNAWRRGAGDRASGAVVKRMCQLESAVHDATWPELVDVVTSHSQLLVFLEKAQFCRPHLIPLETSIPRETCLPQGNPVCCCRVRERARRDATRKMLRSGPLLQAKYDASHFLKGRISLVQAGSASC